MTFREARISDIPQLQVVRNSVQENMLSNPALISQEDYKEYLETRGKGWVCEIDNEIVGFAVADLKEQNVWALFIKPVFEQRGIGKVLHKTMLDWYFSQTQKTIWLGTGSNTRAEAFYRMQGWTEAGMNGAKEIKFEMTFDNWKIKM